MAHILDVPPQLQSAPTVAPAAAPPDDYQRITATPQAFGAQVGAAEEDVGQHLAQAGKFFGQVAADDATNKWQADVNKLLYGDPNKMGPDGNPDRGYYGLRGEDAMRAMPGIQQQIADLRKQYGAGLTTGEQQLQFDSNTRRMQGILYGEVGRHYEQQFQTYAKATNNSQSDLNLNWIGSHAADEEQVLHGIADLTSSYVKQKQIELGTNLSPEIVHDAQQRAMRDGRFRQIEGLLPTNAPKGQQVLDENRDLLSGDQRYHALAGQLQAKADGIAVNGAALRALGMGAALPSAPQAGDRGTAVERFLDLAESKESGGRNIEQQVVGPNGGFNPSVGRVTGPSTASGHFQITDSTWIDFAPKAGVDLSQYPRAISAPYDVQRQVARTIATTSGVQHWTDYNNKLKAAVQAAGLPVSGPIVRVADNAPAAENGIAAAQVAVPPGPVPSSVGPNVDTGSDATATGATGGPAKPNRTGLPSLADVWQTIMRDPTLRDDQQRERAFNIAKTRYVAEEADAARTERIARDQDQAQMRHAEDQIVADAYSGNPQITAQQIAVDPRFNTDPARRRQMLEWMQKHAEGDRVDPALSHKTEMDLMTDITAGKIADRGPILDAYKNGKLNDAGFNFVTKQLDDIRTPQGERLSKMTEDLIKAVKPQIDHSNPLMGKMDFSGEAQLGVFAYDLRKQVQDARDKNIPVSEIAQTILNPHRYIENPEMLRPYTKPLQQSLKERVSAMTGQTPGGATPPANPVATAPIPPVGSAAETKPNPFVAPAATPSIVPRQPGESLGDYVRRTGIGGAPMGSQAASP